MSAPFKFKSIQDRLLEGSSGPITIQQLAERLSCSVEQLQPLVDHNYLRVVFKKNPFPQTIVACPKEDGLEWLKLMFAPLQYRPFIRLTEVERMLAHYRATKFRKWKNEPLTVERYRVICQMKKIQIYVDPVFGELLDIDGLGKLTRSLWIYKKSVKKDRAGMLAYLLNTLPRKDQVNLKVPRYSYKLSQEINRIAHLPIEQRTVMAMYLYEAWRDSRTVQECLVKLKDMEKYTSKRDGCNYDYKAGPKVAEVVKLDQKMERMKDQVTSID